jgi:hypothetical protein
LPRQAGARETRWTHLLSGAPAAEDFAMAAVAPGEHVAVTELAALRANVATLQQQVAALRATVTRLCTELGTTPDSPS